MFFSTLAWDLAKIRFTMPPFDALIRGACKWISLLIKWGSRLVRANACLVASSQIIIILFHERVLKNGLTGCDDASFP